MTCEQARATLKTGLYWLDITGPPDGLTSQYITKHELLHSFLFLCDSELSMRIKPTCFTTTEQWRLHSRFSSIVDKLREQTNRRIVYEGLIRQCIHHHSEGPNATLYHCITAGQFHTGSESTSPFCCICNKTSQCFFNNRLSLTHFESDGHKMALKMVALQKQLNSKGANMPKSSSAVIKPPLNMVNLASCYFYTISCDNDCTYATLEANMVRTSAVIIRWATNSGIGPLPWWQGSRSFFTGTFTGSVWHCILHVLHNEPHIRPLLICIDILGKLSLNLQNNEPSDSALTISPHIDIVLDHFEVCLSAALDTLKSLHILEAITQANKHIKFDTTSFKFKYDSDVTTFQTVFSDKGIKELAKITREFYLKCTSSSVTPNDSSNKKYEFRIQAKNAANYPIQLIGLPEIQATEPESTSQTSQSSQSKSPGPNAHSTGTPGNYGTANPSQSPGPNWSQVASLDKTSQPQSDT